MKISLIISFILLANSVFSQIVTTEPETHLVACTDGIDNDGDGLIDCDDPDCIINQVQACFDCYTELYSFADSVEYYFNACSDTTNLYIDPTQALGRINFDGFNDNAKFVSLGSGGSLQLAFKDNLIGISGDTFPDIWFYEIGPDKEAAHYALRPYDAYTELIANKFLPDIDGDGFYEFGVVKGGRSFIDIDSFFDFKYEANRLLFDGILLVDVINSSCHGSSPGSDIDAVCATSGFLLEDCYNMIDDDLDGFIDNEDIDCSCQLIDSIGLLVSGSYCEEGISLQAPYFENAIYNWYHDGISLAGETDTILYIGESVGFYEVLIDDGINCFRSEQLAFDSIIHVTNLYEYICEGEIFPYFGQDLDSTGIYKELLTSMVDGCDSIIILELDVVEDPEFVIDRSICKGDSLFWMGEKITEAGTHIFETTSYLGCDSTIVLNLELEDIPLDSIDFKLCYGDTISYHGTDYFDAGVYEQRVTAINACDSLHFIDIEFLPSIMKDTLFEICIGDSVLFNGVSYGYGGDFSSLDKTDEYCTFYSISIREKEIILNDTSVVLCPQEVVNINSHLYWVEGSFQQFFSAHNGCDSILNIEVRKANNSFSFHEFIICEGDALELNGTSYDVAGIYDQTITSFNGCDSIINFDLIVLDTTRIIHNYQLCLGDIVIVEGFEFSDPGEYQIESIDHNNCPLRIDVIITESPNCETCGDGHSENRAHKLIVRKHSNKLYTVSIYSPGSLILEDMVNLKQLKNALRHYVIAEYCIVKALEIPEVHQFWDPVIEESSFTLSNKEMKQIALWNNIDIERMEMLKLDRIYSNILSRITGMADEVQFSKSGL